MGRNTRIGKKQHRCFSATYLFIYFLTILSSGLGSAVAVPIDDPEFQKILEDRQYLRQKELTK